MTHQPKKKEKLFKTVYKDGKKYQVNKVGSWICPNCLGVDECMCSLKPKKKENWAEEFYKIWANKRRLIPHDEYMAQTRIYSFLCSKIHQAKEEEREKLSNWLQHDRECVRSECTAGRPTEDGGYEQKFAGKWYQSRPVDKTPKCDCGLDEALSSSHQKEANHE